MAILTRSAQGLRVSLVSVDARSIRNLGVVAHINAGKTTLTERMLFDSGAQRFLGEVDDGTAAMDFLPQEQQRGISIRAANTTVSWRGCALNLVDTPGHVDFSGEVDRVLRVLDGAVLVLDGVRGVESQTETVWRQAKAQGVAVLAFVNKLDRPVADWARCLDSLRERLAVRVLPAVVPTWSADGLCGLIEVVSGARQDWRAGGEPLSDVAQARTALIEAAADFDPAVMEAFVGDLPVDAERLRAALRRAVVAGSVTLAFAGAALPNRGVELLLDGVVDYLPAPVDRTASGDASAPLRALVFGRVHEPPDAVAVRLHAGTVAAGLEVDGSDGQRRRVRAVLRMHASSSELTSDAGPGDIVALQLDGAPVRLGAALFTPGCPVEYPALPLAAPVLAVALEPRQAEDRAVVEGAAQALVQADPTLALRFDRAREVWLLVGMGELHLEVACDELRARVGDRFRVGRPEVDCRETIRQAGRGEGEWRLPELGMRAVVELRLHPVPHGGPATVRLGAGAQSELGQRLAEVLAAHVRSGLNAGWPGFDFEVVVESVVGEAEGDFDALSAVADEAAKVALRRASAMAQGYVLQPLMTIEVACPHDTLSAVLADLRGKELRAAQVDADAERSTVRGVVPLARVLGYATRLRSLTKGRGAFAMRAAGYGEPATP